MIQCWMLLYALVTQLAIHSFGFECTEQSGVTDTDEADNEQSSSSAADK